MKLVGRVSSTSCVFLVATLSLLVSGLSQPAILRCSQGSPPKEIRYHFTAGCKQSSMKAIGAKSFSTVQECMQLANKKRAFAINFVHKALLHSAALNFSKETCVLYDCPELGIRHSDQGNSVYDYYSAYARPEPKTNVSCIPKVGLFQLHRDRKTFENAEKACASDGGVLADITSDLHTTHLSSLIATLNVSIAYVGLKQWNESQEEYLTSTGLPLSCLKFRAWAPNEPRPIPKNRCVYLTTNGYWKVKDCDRKLPFLCELKPQGPLQPCRRIRNSKKKTMPEEIPVITTSEEQESPVWRPVSKTSKSPAAEKKETAAKTWKFNVW